MFFLLATTVVHGTKSQSYYTPKYATTEKREANRVGEKKNRYNKMRFKLLISEVFNTQDAQKALIQRAQTTFRLPLQEGNLRYNCENR